MHNRRYNLLAATMLAAVGTAGGAHAQAAPEGNSIETLIVTARRSSENLQDIPVTVVALSDKSLEKFQIKSLNDMNNLAPGLNFQSAGARGGSGRLNMRGVSGGTTGGAKASVFLDGVYQTTEIGNISFSSLARVEVLPGPQSAQFGRATFAGAVNYVTKDPTADFRADGSLEVATQNLTVVTANVSGPITENLGFTLNAYVNSFRGDKDWRSSPDALHPNGVRMGGQLTRSVAGKLVYRPTDALKISFRNSYSWDHDAPAVIGVMDPNLRNLRIVRPDGTVANYFRGTIYNYQLDSIDVDSYFGKLTDPGRYNWAWRNNLIAEYQLGTFTITGTAAYNWEKTKSQSGIDFTGYASRDTISASVHDDTQYELRVASDPSKPIRYGFGGYYFDNRSSSPIGGGLGTFTVLNCLSICTVLPNGGFTGVNQQVNTFLPATGSLSTIRTRSIFGSLFWDATDSLTASFEGRYQVESIKGYAAATQTLNAPQVIQKTFLPRVNLQYKFSPSLQVYTVYSVGQTPGGSNTSQFIGTPGTNTTDADRTYKGDKLYNYEVGLKGLWFDRRLQAAVAVYHMDWKDMVVSSTYFVPGTNTNFAVSLNRGSSTIDGFTAEVNAVPNDALDFRATISYNKSVYKNFCSVTYFSLVGIPAGPPGAPNSRCSTVDGNRLENMPALVGSFSAGYTRHLTNEWETVFRATYLYQEGQWESDGNFAKTKPSHVFNLTAALQKEGRSITLFCRNCTSDTSMLRTAILSDPRSSAASGFGNRDIGGNPRFPRQVGVTLAYAY